MKIIIATVKSWNIENAKRLKSFYNGQHTIKVLEQQEDLDFIFLQQYNPDYIFFPHWPYIISSDIYQNFKCVVFHMTDLPYGRGGSPLQNLIVRGKKDTMLSAIQVEKELDAGAIYMKMPLSLEGSAAQILRRASNIIFEQMIPKFLLEELYATPQVGEAVFFKRRKPEESELLCDMPMDQIYDHIRMLDGEGYPNAFIKFGKYKFEFTQSIYDGKRISAHVIIQEGEE